MKRKLKGFLLFGAAALTATAFTALSASCGEKEEDKFAAKYEKILEANKAELNKLKQSLDGYSKDSFEILSNKAEITEQSKGLIKAFNKFFGTNITWTQVGSSANYATTLNTKFANSVGNTILVGAESKSAFQQLGDKVVNTSAQEFLKDYTGSSDDIIVSEKHFMPQAVESYGVIYNKDVFAKANITVFEGESFKADKVKDVTLTKPEAYNGVVEHEGKYYVFSADLTLDGFNKIIEVLKAKEITPMYSVARVSKNDIWPITNHLMNSAVVARLAGSEKPGQPLYEKMMDSIKSHPENIFTADLVKSLQEALKIYQWDADENKKTNNPNEGMTRLALGQVAMIQNGTWGFAQAKATKADVQLGFLPLPIANVNNDKLALYKGATQRWAATTLNQKEDVKKTTKLFLQFLYQTKAGVEILANDLGSSNPYETNIKLDTVNDQLINSSSNYVAGNYDVWAMANFPSNFNNNNPKLVELTNNGFGLANNKSTEEVANELLKVWNELRAAEKAPANNK